MADDGQSGKDAVAHEAVRSGQVPIGHQTRAESAPPAERRRSMFRNWRPIMVLGIFLIALSAGFYFHSHSNPGTEPATFSDQPPQYINVYETNPLIPIAVTVTFGQGFHFPDYDRYLSPIELHVQGFTGFHEIVEITARPTGSVRPGTIILTSSTRPLTGRAAANAGEVPTPRPPDGARDDPAPSSDLLSQFRSSKLKAIPGLALYPSTRFLSSFRTTAQLLAICPQSVLAIF